MRILDAIATEWSHASRGLSAEATSTKYLPRLKARTRDERPDLRL